MNRHDLDNIWSATLRRESQTVRDFDRLANAVVDVHNSGDGQFRQHVHNRLKEIGRRIGDEHLPETEFDLCAACLLIADEIGYVDWKNLIDAVANTDENNKPIIFQYAVAAMERGDFSALESTVGGPEAFDDEIIGWFENGYFEDESDTLAEIFSASCMLGHERTATYLLDKGVDPYAGMKTGLSGFHYAASSGRLNIIKLLIARGVPMEIENMYGGTVFGQAMWSAVNEHTPNHAAIIEALIEAGAVVDPGYQKWWDEQAVPTDTKRHVAKALRRAQE